MTQHIASKLDIDGMKSDMDKMSDGKSNANANVKFFKLVNGDNFYHVLPPWEGNVTRKPYHEVFLHFLSDQEGKSRTYLCSKKAEGACAICDRSRALKDSKFEQDIELSKKLYPTRRFMYNVSNSKHEVGILSVGPTCHEQIVAEIYDDAIHGFDPIAYEQGLLIKITRTGSTWNNTDYRARGERNRVNLPPELATNYNKLPKLDQIYVVYTNAELKQVLDGNFDPKGIRNKAAEAISFPPVTPTASTVVESPVTKPTEDGISHMNHNEKLAYAKKLLGQ